MLRPRTSLNSPPTRSRAARLTRMIVPSIRVMKIGSAIGDPERSFARPRLAGDAASAREAKLVHALAKRAGVDVGPRPDHRRREVLSVGFDQPDHRAVPSIRLAHELEHVAEHRLQRLR